MPRESKYSILQTKTFKKLKEIESKLDARTYASRYNNILATKGESALNKLLTEFETINDLNADVKLTKKNY